MKFEFVKDLLEWLHQQYNAGIEFPAHGRVSFHVYRRKLIGGGVEGNLWLGPGIKEADLKFQEETPGVLTIAVVSCGAVSIGYTTRKPFAGTTRIDEVRMAFPDGRNINLIITELLSNCK